MEPEKFKEDDFKIDLLEDRMEFAGWAGGDGGGGGDGGDACCHNNGCTCDGTGDGGDGGDGGNGGDGGVVIKEKGAN